MNNIHTVSVTDSFELSADRAGSQHEPGIVVIFDGRQCGFDLPAIGATIEMLRPDGRVLKASVAEIKEHGDGRSLFFRGLSKSDVPVATVMYWEAAKPASPPLSAAGRR